MRVVMFYHSLCSDWNHGNAHFLRGIVSELMFRGHDVEVYEPSDGWSLSNLLAEHGEDSIEQFRKAYPRLQSIRYEIASIDLDEVLADARLVLVHEWNDPTLVHRIGQHRKKTGSYHLLFHDTHHRAVTQPAEMKRYDLRHFDGVLAYGSVLRDLYLHNNWTRRAWTWHEAADTRIFRPIASRPCAGDLIWIGNWGDDERSSELQEFLLKPAQDLAIKTRVHGVRYPDEAKAALADAEIEYAGWIPNFSVPDVFAEFKATVHIPRRPYVRTLPGIPTIRVFEALACGIPLICSPWDDVEGLFQPGQDYLVAANGLEMERHLAHVLADPRFARELAAHGHRTILSRHTCAHRVDELLNIAAELEAEATGTRRPSTPQKESRCITA